MLGANTIGAELAATSPPDADVGKELGAKTFDLGANNNNPGA
jgi:hypothetical protein